MILFDLLKTLYNLGSNLENVITVNNIWVCIDHIKIDNKIDEIQGVLVPLGFDYCLEFDFKANHRVWINDNRDYISYWEYDINNDVPFVFEVQDLLDNDLDYLVLKYGKILLREVI